MKKITRNIGRKTGFGTLIHKAVVSEYYGAQQHAILMLRRDDESYTIQATGFCGIVNNLSENEAEKLFSDAIEYINQKVRKAS